MARFETTLQRPNARTVPLPRQIGTLPNTLSGAASDANSQNGGAKRQKLDPDYSFDYRKVGERGSIYTQNQLYTNRHYSM
uniref:SORBS2 n=1 Tax=Echinococcus granulosus TaxID=6210 RepID=A0A068WDG3_ECHGR|nr:hypothetical protein EgrG_000889400 [Echinococcus granulosus]